MNTERGHLGKIAAAVAACALVVHVGALFNGFAMDDVAIIAMNPLVRSGDGWWAAFAQPYWPPELGGKMYRPIPVATYTLDSLLAAPWWFHAVNLLWHAGVAVLVAFFARRLAGDRAALVAGLVFAVHPVHVEAVANVVGRAELMATLFASLSVYAVYTRRHPAWSAVAFAAGLLCKENAVVAPALAAWLWIVGIDRPSRRTMGAYAIGWMVVGLAYAAVRWQVLHPYARFEAIAPMFVGESATAVRLTAVGALADVLRLLVFPAQLRVEYSPQERAILSTPLDLRFVAGLAALVIWIGLLAWAWRRGRKVEAFGLGWIAVAYLPVANILFPTGVVIAERTLYLPSVGLALAFGAVLSRLAVRDLTVVLGVLVLAGGIRTATRVPVWRDDRSVTLSMLRDSPKSYRGPARMGALFQTRREAGRALDAYQMAIAAFDRDATLYVAAADAAFTVNQPALADSLLELGNRICFRCTGGLRFQARGALSRGDTATAAYLEAWANRLEQP